MLCCVVLVDVWCVVFSFAQCCCLCCRFVWLRRVGVVLTLCSFVWWCGLVVRCIVLSCVVVELWCMVVALVSMLVALSCSVVLMCVALF